MRKGEELVFAAGDEVIHDHHHDGVDRRGFLKCMAWAGAGAFCVMKGACCIPTPWMAPEVTLRKAN